MRKLWLAAALAFGTGCAEAPLAPADEYAPQAELNTDGTWQDYPYTSMLDCAGNLVTITAKWRSDSEMKKPGMIRSYLQVVGHGSSAVGRYVFHQTQHVVTHDAGMDNVSIYMQRLIGQGGIQDMVIQNKFVLHYPKLPRLEPPQPYCR